jgi:ABC-type glycerol-3-phosphate transport system substrate-binding protein
MHKFRHLLLVLLSLAFLNAARVFADAGADVTLQPPREPVTITFWHAMGGPLGEALNSMIRDFERTHPDVRITSISMGDYSSLAQKLMSALWVKSPPVMAQMYESWTTQFYEANELYPLESMVSAESGERSAAGVLSDIYPALIEDNSWDGQLVTFPFNKSVPCYYYNVRRFDSLGICEFPKTWAEFRVAAKRLTRRAPQLKDWIWGTAGGVNASVFVSMLLSHNGALLDESTGKPLFASPAAIDVLQYQADMILKDSSQVFSVGYSGQDDLLAGRLGMIYGTSVSKAFMRGKSSLPIGMAPLPYWDKPAAIIQGTNVGLFRKTTRAERAAAWAFIKWFTAPEQQAHWAARTFYVPVCRSALQVPEFKAVLDSTPGWRACVEQMEWGVFEPKSRVWFEGRKIMDSGLEPALRGILGPEQSLTQAAALMAPSLANQGRVGFYVVLALLAAGVLAGIVVVVRRVNGGG